MMKNETKKQTFDRSAGVLMSISSLPSDYGIGTMGKAAYEFADFVRACNHKYWQVLPIGSTTYGDSPYQSGIACYCCQRCAQFMGDSMYRLLP